MVHDDDVVLVKQANDALRAGNVHAALEYLYRFFDGHPVQTNQERAIAAWQVLRREYIQELEEAVDSIRGDYCDGTYAASCDDLQRDIDGVAATYTDNEGDAQKCLIFSENANASYLEHGEVPEDWRDNVPWSALAYAAFRTDMREELKSAGIDIYRTPPDSDEIAVNCDSCGEIRVATPGEETCTSCHEEAGNVQCENCKTWRAEEDLEDDLCENCATKEDE